jgi:hypothetical protein
MRACVGAWTWKFIKSKAVERSLALEARCKRGLSRCKCGVRFQEREECVRLRVFWTWKLFKSKSSFFIFQKQICADLSLLHFLTVMQMCIV